MEPTKTEPLDSQISTPAASPGAPAGAAATEPQFALRATRYLLAVVIVLGLVLRVIWPDVTVFCEDQARACALAEDVANGRWQTGGVINSGKFRNLPGFVYFLAAVCRLSPEPCPVTMQRCIALLNVAAVLGAAWLMKRWVGSAAAWWGTALLAAGPWAIHYCRWIWAQHLFFPIALLVFLLVWLTVFRGRRKLILAVVLALAVAVHVHLAAIVLALAVGAYVLWSRAPFSPRLALVGGVIAGLSIVPYLRDGHLHSPRPGRLGYRHFWRAAPGAAMSVSWLNWRLEFREGYPAFARQLAWRRWPYEAVMLLPAGLLAWGTLAGLRHAWKTCRRDVARRRDPLVMTTVLVILIPLFFCLLGIRTSPTYLPQWYPLPFILMGWVLTKQRQRIRRWLEPIGVAVLVVQLCFFTEQLLYMRNHGGVPGSPLGRSFVAAKADIEALRPQVRAGEIWMDYDGPSIIQDEAAAYLLRHVAWEHSAAGRVLIHFQWGTPPYAWVDRVEPLPAGTDPPVGAFLIYPWAAAPQQRDGRVAMY